MEYKTNVTDLITPRLLFFLVFIISAVIFHKCPARRWPSRREWGPHAELHCSCSCNGTLRALKDLKACTKQQIYKLI